VSSPRIAINFLIRASELAGGDEDTGKAINLTEAEYAIAFNELCEKGFNWDLLHELFEPSSPDDLTIEAAKKQIKRLGLTSTAVVVNGKVASTQGDSMGFMESVQEALMEVMDFIRAKRIRSVDKFDIKSLLSSKYKTLPAFNQKILAVARRGLGISSKPLAKMIEIASEYSKIEWTGSSPPKIFQR
jgi:hypothetical protein